MADRSARLRQLQNFYEQDPNDSFIRFALAKEYEKLGQLAEAQKQFEALRQHDPSYVGLYYHLGKLYEANGKAKAAWECYTMGMDSARKLNDQHALSELAGARLALGDEDDFV